MKELVVISGKGGTGKTSIVASFAALATNKVMADCDVDAADLHLVLSPEIKLRADFSGGKQASVVADKCIGCGKCLAVCRFDAVTLGGPPNDVLQKTYCIDSINCEGCGVCEYYCPAGAIDFSDKINGEWFISATRHGPMVHAKLGVAAENSGKLVTLVKREAKQLAEKNAADLVLVDGSPGIGCPVIASIVGASMVLIITEPTMSGLHDLNRVADLAGHFRIPAAVCVNKCDISPEMTAEIDRHAVSRGLDVLGHIHYDSAVTRAQIAGQSVVEFGESNAADDIRALWNRTSKALTYNSKSSNQEE